MATLAMPTPSNGKRARLKMRSPLSVLVPQSKGNALVTVLMSSRFLSAAAMRSEESHHQTAVIMINAPIGAALSNTPRPAAGKLSVAFRLILDQRLQARFIPRPGNRFRLRVAFLQHSDHPAAGYSTCRLALGSRGVDPASVPLPYPALPTQRAFGSVRSGTGGHWCHARSVLHKRVCPAAGRLIRKVHNFNKHLFLLNAARSGGAHNPQRQDRGSCARSTRYLEDGQ